MEGEPRSLMTTSESAVRETEGQELRRLREEKKEWEMERGALLDKISILEGWRKVDEKTVKGLMEQVAEKQVADETTGSQRQHETAEERRSADIKRRLEILEAGRDLELGLVELDLARGKAESDMVDAEQARLLVTLQKAWESEKKAELKKRSEVPRKKEKELEIEGKLAPSKVAERIAAAKTEGIQEGKRIGEAGAFEKVVSQAHEQGILFGYHLAQLTMAVNEGRVKGVIDLSRGHNAHLRSITDGAPFDFRPARMAQDVGHHYAKCFVFKRMGVDPKLWATFAERKIWDVSQLIDPWLDETTLASGQILPEQMRRGYFSAVWVQVLKSMQYWREQGSKLLPPEKSSSGNAKDQSKPAQKAEQSSGTDGTGNPSGMK